MCSVGGNRICSYHDDLYLYRTSHNNRCAATRIPKGSKGVKACQYATKACEDPGSAMKALAMGKMKGFLTKDHHFQQGVFVRKERFSFKYFQIVIYSSQIGISSNDACSQSSCSVFLRQRTKNYHFQQGFLVRGPAFREKSASQRCAKHLQKNATEDEWKE